jgi:hypothetical protein
MFGAVRSLRVPVSRVGNYAVSIDILQRTSRQLTFY